jgi:UDP-N-acetylglucosamine--dolichyl-phosphate N-acetylglucosaminephosphotransferase
MPLQQVHREEATTLFPRVPDQHKTGKPLVPNGLGVIYVLFTTVYLFLLYFSGVVTPVNNVSAPLTLAVCILFGGFMGLLDDWMDLKWRYKAFMPLIAALPLVYLAREYVLRPTISLPFLGVINFGEAYYFIIIPLIVMIVTNTVNQLGGLNGLETICPAIVLVGLMALSWQSYLLLMVGPLLFWFALAAFNFRGKIFVGNSGSFAIGMTIASFAVITDLKFNLLISILPYIFNSSLILLTVFLTGKRAQVIFDGKKLVSYHRRSLITLITHKRPLTEHQVVAVITSLVAVFTALTIIVGLL